MAYGTLVQLRLVEVNGPLSRELVVRESITMYHLHRALQFCLKPRQSDVAVDSKAFKFYDASGKTLVTAAKEHQLDRNNVNKSTEAKVGDSYLYEYDDGKKKRQFMVQAVGLSWQDARYEVPRCIAGRDGATAVNVDPINQKLLVRRFSRHKAGQRKPTRGFWCDGDVSNEEIMGWHMAAMKEGIVPVDDKPASKKTTVKKTTNKKTPAKKTAATKAAGKKTPVKKTPLKKTMAAKKVGGAVKKKPVTAPGVKKPAIKRSAGKRKVRC